MAKKATRTSLFLDNAHSRFRRRSGFSLVEIMVVLVILGLVVGIGIPSINTRFRVGLKSAARHMVGAVRFSFDQAALEGKIYRLVIDINESKYWVESMESRQNIFEDTLIAAEDGKDSKDKPKEGASIPFKKVELRSGDEQQLPTGISFRSVLHQRTEKVIDQGKSFIHFFPHGFAEQAIIHLQNQGDEDAVYSLLISPMTGKVTIYHEYVDSFETKD